MKDEDRNSDSHVSICGRECTATSTVRLASAGTNSDAMLWGELSLATPTLVRIVPTRLCPVSRVTDTVSQVRSGYCTVISRCLLLTIDLKFGTIFNQEKHDFPYEL